MTNKEQLIVKDERTKLLSSNEYGGTNSSSFHSAGDNTNYETASCSSSFDEDEMITIGGMKCPSLRRIALRTSLWINVLIALAKLLAYLHTFSLSVLAALLDSILDVVSQLVLNYTEKHSSMQRSSTFYPAGASRLEPIGVLTCAALMGMASFEVLKESFQTLIFHKSSLVDDYNEDDDGEEGVDMSSFWSMLTIVFVKLALVALCYKAANKRETKLPRENRNRSSDNATSSSASAATTASMHATVNMADPTIEAVLQDHWNDALSNTVAAVALLFALRSPSLWYLDPIGAIIISIYIIYSWYMTGREQIEHLTGMAAPDDFLEELREIATNFDDRMKLDCIRAYHFGPKFLVELEMVMAKETLLFESHDLGMDLQYEIEGRDEVERCFVHIDYETRPYDEHVVSKVPELRQRYKGWLLTWQRNLYSIEDFSELKDFARKMYMHDCPGQFKKEIKKWTSSMDRGRL